MIRERYLYLYGINCNDFAIKLMARMIDYSQYFNKIKFWIYKRKYNSEENILKYEIIWRYISSSQNKTG